MNRIIFPLNFDTMGLEVMNLQDGLLFLLSQNFYQGDPLELEEIGEQIDAERANMRYRDFTARLVQLFQEQTSDRFGLEPSGMVEAETATALNQVLTERGALDPVVEPPPAHDPTQPRLVAGVIRSADQQPYSGGKVSAYHRDDRGQLRLGEDTSDGEGRYTIRYPLPPGTAAATLIVTVSGPGSETLGGAGPIEQAGPVQFLDIQLATPGAQPPAVEPPPTQRSMEGRVIFEDGTPAEGISLQLFKQGFGGAQTLMSSATTQAHGLYALPFSLAGSAAGLVVSAVAEDGALVPLTKPLHNLGEAGRALVNLVAPLSLRSQPSEYERLAADLAPHVGDLSNLAGAREDDDQQDFTILNRDTGWDARLIALASTAATLAANPEMGLEQPVLYGLMRLGLPGEPVELAQVSPDVFNQALTSAMETKIIRLEPEQETAARERFESFSHLKRLAMPAPGSNATYGDLLQSSGVSEAGRDVFAKVFLNHSGDPAQLWSKALDAGVPEGDITVLQRQGKLAYLTTNSAALTLHLQQSMEISDPQQLVDQDFFEAPAWYPVLNRAAGLTGPLENREPGQLSGGQRERLRAVIPPGFTGETLAEARDAYAEDMARKLRSSYPTQVVTRLIERDAEDEFSLGESRQPVLNFMKSDAGQSFRLGETPVEAYFKSLPEQVAGLDGSQMQTAKQSLKTLQRVYQMTPDNQSMPALMKMGLTSAHDITAVPLFEFVERFGKHTKDPEKAKLIYRKAEQVSAVTHNLFTMARKLDSQRPVGVIGAPAETRKLVRDKLIKEFPTLERLFGSLDFCECEHCRSVLSPAAYLVDLLQFLDQNADHAQAGSWAHRMEKWEADHQAVPYPFRNAGEQDRYLSSWRRRHPGEPDPDTRKTPYEMLVERRPDLPNITLTCENTNTTLPYIDIVNEILEYYVANQALKPEAARETGSATSAELLAEPQYVIASAYRKLQQARYPMSLPFDLPIETVRRFSDYFEIPFARLLETFCPTGDLDNPDMPYDRYAVLIELLGLSFAEADLFTGPDPLASWFTLYGFHSAEEALTSTVDEDTGQRVDLNSAKALARCLGLTYQELVDVLRTGFVNPGFDQRVLLHKLGLTAEQALAYQTDQGLVGLDPSTMTPEGRERAAEATAVKKRLDDFSAGHPGFDAAGRLEATLLQETFASVLVLADSNSSCDFDQTTLQFSNGQPIDGFALLKINLFTRLWRRLGGSIQEVDTLLGALIPAGAPFDADHLAQSPLKTTLIFLARLKELEERLRPGKDGRVKLLSLWGPIPTRGKDSLYARLFLTRAVLALDPVFDDPLGDYLSEASLAASAGWHTFSASRPNIPPEERLDPDLFAGETRLKLEHDPIEQAQRLSFVGAITGPEKEALLALAPDNTLLSGLLDEVEQMGKDWPLLKSHLPPVQSALGLAASDIDRILKPTGLTLEEARLSLDTLSLLYRHTLLAKYMKLSVADLVTLKELSDLDPFQALDAAAAAGGEVDAAFTQTLAFVEAAALAADSGLKTEDLDYLLRHSYDPNGKYRPDPPAGLALLRRLSGGVQAARAEHIVPPLPERIGEELLRQKLSLALSPEVVDRFLAMISGTVELTAVQGGIPPEQALAPADFVGEPVVCKVFHNPARNEQLLTIRGVLPPGQIDTLKARFPIQVFADLLDKTQAQARQFFESYLQKQKLRQEEETGFLNPGDFEDFFTQLRPIPPGAPQETVDAIQKENEDSLNKARRQALEAFLPYLMRRLERQLAVQTLSEHTGLDTALVRMLLTSPNLMGGDRPLVDTFTSAGAAGLTAEFFTGNDLATGPLPAGPTFGEADTGLAAPSGNRLRPPEALSARFSGRLEVPTAGAYRFYLHLDKAGVEATLRFDHLAQALLQATAPADGADWDLEPDEFIELKPGIPYRFTLEVKNLDDDGGDARLLVQGETLPKAGLSQLGVLADAGYDEFEHAGARLSKAVQLFQTLGLNEAEGRFLLDREGSFGGLDLSQIPGGIPKEEASAEEMRALFDGFARLARYQRLKREMAGGTDGLLPVLSAPGLEEAIPDLAKLLRREKNNLEQAVRALFLPPLLVGVPLVGGASQEGSLARLWKALQILEQFGASASALSQWTRVAGRSLAFERRFAIARALRETLKARLEPDAWQRVARAVFDQLRERQRDSLAAYVMHQARFARLEQLYEYFLVDPGMQPVVQTSRIRLAIASVQLFIQRCLLNLEHEVHPTVINARQWEWMKRYRVWEANRRIFLFPENWLEPEFRDDKTHLFRELEGDLLQGDVSDDLAEDAFLNYLKKLEELARLDIIALYVEEKTGSAAATTLHVIGRTYSTPHKYFHRRNLKGIWTPWEPVSAEIQGEHLAPVVWRDRLYLFWVTFMDKSDPNAQVIDPNEERVQAKKMYSTAKIIHFENKGEQPSELVKALAMGPMTSQESFKDSDDTQKTSDNLAQMTLSQIAGGVRNGLTRKLVEVHLHWSEYFKGEWSTRESGAYTSAVYASVPLDFNPDSVYIHVSKDPEPEGEPRGVRIHLGSPINAAFFLAGRNAQPRRASAQPPPHMPYNRTGTRANRYIGIGPLKVTFTRRYTQENGGNKVGTPDTPEILRRGGEYTLLAAANQLSRSDPEIAALISPFFYQSDEHTFYVQPSVVEKTIQDWQEWLPPPPAPEKGQDLPSRWNDLVVPFAARMRDPLPLNAGDPVWKVPFHPDMKFQMKGGQDWLLNSGTVFNFSGELIGPAGRAGVAVIPAAEAGEAARAGALLVRVGDGSHVAPESALVAKPGSELQASGLRQSAAGLNVIGRAGLNTALVKNLRR